MFHIILKKALHKYARYNYVVTKQVLYRLKSTRNIRTVYFIVKINVKDKEIKNISSK